MKGVGPTLHRQFGGNARTAWGKFANHAQRATCNRVLELEK